MKKSFQQAQLINSFFDLKDKKDIQEKTLMKIEDLYNLSITPRPQILKGLEDFYKQIDFAELSTLTDEKRIQEEIDKITKLEEGLDDFSSKLEALEIKLKRYVAVKQGLNKDEELNELKKMIKILSAKKSKVRQSMLLGIKEESDNEASEDENVEELTLEEMATFCDMKISEIVINFHANLIDEGHKFVEDIKREIEPDLLMVLNDQNDQQFLKDAEINDMKIDALESKLRNLQKNERELKNAFKKYEKKIAMENGQGKPTHGGVHIPKHDFLKKIDKLGNLKHYRSSGCLELKDHRIELTGDVKNKEQFVKNTLLLQEVVLDKKEQLAFTQRHFKEEKHASFDQLKELFQKLGKQESTINIDDIEKKTKSMKNKTMKEHTNRFIEEFRNMDGYRIEAEKETKDGGPAFTNLAEKIKNKFDEVKKKIEALN